MKKFFTRNRILLVVATVVTVVLAVVVNFTEIYRLKAVTLDGQPLSNWQEKYGLSSSRLLTNQPIDLVATELLGYNDVVKVDVDYQFPGTIRIRTNEYSPAAFLVDRTIGEIWGLDQSGRIVPLDKSQENWELPFFTGLIAGRAYGGCEDLRVSVTLNQLARLAESDADAHATIGEVNFTSTVYLLVHLDGLASPVKVTPDGLARQIATVVNFVRSFHPDLSDALTLDPRFGNLVVKECIPDTTKEDSKSSSTRSVEAYN